MTTFFPLFSPLGTPFWTTTVSTVFLVFTRLDPLGALLFSGTLPSDNSEKSINPGKWVKSVFFHEKGRKSVEMWVEKVSFSTHKSLSSSHDLRYRNIPFSGTPKNH